MVPAMVMVVVPHTTTAAAVNHAKTYKIEWKNAQNLKRSFRDIWTISLVCFTGWFAKWMDGWLWPKWFAAVACDSRTIYCVFTLSYQWVIAQAPHRSMRQKHAEPRLSSIAFCFISERIHAKEKNNIRLQIFVICSDNAFKHSITNTLNTVPL